MAFLTSPYLQKLLYAIQMTIWVAAGAAGLIAFVAAGALKDCPSLFKQLVLSTAILSGGALGLTRVQFEWKATTIRRCIKNGCIKEDAPLPDCETAWPSGPERMWRTSLLALAAGWLLVFVAIWWPQISRIVICLTRG